MRKVCIILSLLALGGVPALAADPVDGKWVAKIQNKKKGAQELVLNLKADGDRLTGTVSQGRKGRGLDITDGKISGDTISFTTAGGGRRKQQPARLHWTAKIEGNELKGTRQRDGAKRGQPFTAVKQ